MTVEISITAAITIAITARLMYLLYLNGKTISSVSITGRAVALLRTALFEFAEGWRDQKWSYLFIAYPSMLFAMGLTSLGIYAIIPVLGHSAGFWDVFRYCLLIVLASVPICLFGAFLIIYGIYLLKLLIRTWWNRRGKPKKHDGDPAAPFTASANNTSISPVESAGETTNEPAEAHSAAPAKTALEGKKPG